MGGPVAMTVRAVRGAIQVDADERDLILTAVAELLTAVLDRNGWSGNDLISVILTSTDDLHSEFPAYAVRLLGLGDVPLLCARELDIVYGMPRVIRLLAHVETAKSRDAIRHVYLGGAAALRTDLPR